MRATTIAPSCKCVAFRNHYIIGCAFSACDVMSALNNHWLRFAKSAIFLLALVLHIGNIVSVIINRYSKYTEKKPHYYCLLSVQHLPLSTSPPSLPLSTSPVVSCVTNMCDHITASYIKGVEDLDLVLLPIEKVDYIAFLRYVNMHFWNR